MHTRISSQVTAMHRSRRCSIARNIEDLILLDSLARSSPKSVPLAKFQAPTEYKVINSAVTEFCEVYVVCVVYLLKFAWSTQIPWTQPRYSVLRRGHGKFQAFKWRLGSLLSSAEPETTEQWSILPSRSTEESKEKSATEMDKRDKTEKCP